MFVDGSQKLKTPVNLDDNCWHNSFNPKEFLSKVNTSKFLNHLKSSSESHVTASSSPCILCKSTCEGTGILLNDKSFLCAQCLSKVETISYPKKYEELRRSFIDQTEARRLARTELIENHQYTKPGHSFFLYAALSLGLAPLHLALLAVPIAIFILAILTDKEQERKYTEWVARLAEWDKDYKEPTEPTLRHFHDPEVELTSEDKQILKIFNNWPEYPPFWDYLTKIVRIRDNNRCQVSGCPSRVALHVHHKTPISKGGEHVPNNLLTLCDFHHALEPDKGHQQIWGNVKTRYFTLVREHTRSNRTNSGHHSVRPHVRRKELVSKSELEQIKEYYSLSCPSCDSNQIEISVLDNKVMVRCNDCIKNWEFSKTNYRRIWSKISGVA